MPLSNCSNCKYHSDPLHSTDIACAIQPHYASMWLKLKSLESSTLNCLPVDNCSDFELSPDFQPIEITLTLTPQQWRDLAHSCPIPQFIEAIKPHIELDSYNWIEVDSSCIQAIAYNQLKSLLKIQFINNGAVYQYHQVSSDVFDEFLNHHSKGRYFNEHIKEFYVTDFIGYETD